MKSKTTRTGEVTRYLRNGVWVERKRHNDAGNPSKSRLQDANRRRWENVMNLWKAFSISQWKPRYQNKIPGQTDYNCFTALALQGIKIYLTREEARNFSSVLIPLTISDGTLPAIGVEFDGIGVRSDISVGDLTIGEETRVCDLARAIMFNNQGYQKGDIITFVAGRQEVWPPFNHPHARFRYCSFPLDLHDERPISMLPGSGEAFSVRKGFVASMVTEGACTWVHERKVTAGEKIVHYCSKQTMWCSNEEVIAQHSGQSALDASIASYDNLKGPGFLAAPPQAEDLAGKI